MIIMEGNKIKNKYKTGLIILIVVFLIMVGIILHKAFYPSLRFGQRYVCTSEKAGIYSFEFSELEDNDSGTGCISVNYKGNWGDTDYNYYIEDGCFIYYDSPYSKGDYFGRIINSFTIEFDIGYGETEKFVAENASNFFHIFVSITVCVLIFTILQFSLYIKEKKKQRNIKEET